MLLELLEQWARYEPERCVKSSGRFYVSKTPSPPGHAYLVSEDTLFGALRAAIEARNWAWTVSGYAPAKSRSWCDAYIDTNLDDEDPLVEGASGEHDTSPTTALLEAYVKLLKAEWAKLN